ncbi:hypothetical protein [Microviridae sp.]|nr:hypothetical protein [Microviridae sp.]
MTKRPSLRQNLRGENIAERTLLKKHLVRKVIVKNQRVVMRPTNIAAKFRTVSEILIVTVLTTREIPNTNRLNSTTKPLPKKLEMLRHQRTARRQLIVVISQSNKRILVIKLRLMHTPKRPIARTI